MKISRRHALKGLSLGAGGLFLSPLLAQIQAQAAGASRFKQRFVFVLEGNGLHPNQVTPLGIERKDEVNQLVNRPLVGMELPEPLQPIKAFQDRLLVVNGLSGRVCGGGHSNDFGALGCYSAGGGVGNSGAPAGETIDVALGRHLGGIFPHVGLGIAGDKHADTSVIYNCSALARGKPVPTTVDPMVAYGNLFGSVAGGQAKADFQVTANMLDFLLDDVKQLSGQVASAERVKLEAHLSAYENMRDRQSRLNEIENTLRQQAPVADDKYRSEVETDRLDAMFDLSAAALIGGLTNSVTIASGAGNPFFGIHFTGLGIDFGKHGIGHGQGYNGKTAAELTVIIRRFHFELIARLMNKLKAVPEGDGTMLDNTTIVYMSDAAESHHSRCWEWPFVLLPGLNSGLQLGRYVQYPYWNRTGHREIGNLYTTLLKAAGQERAYFGVHDVNLEPGAIGDGPLPDLLLHRC